MSCKAEIVLLPGQFNRVFTSTQLDLSQLK